MAKLLAAAPAPTSAPEPEPDPPVPDPEPAVAGGDSSDRRVATLQARLSRSGAARASRRKARIESTAAGGRGSAEEKARRLAAIMPADGAERAALLRNKYKQQGVGDGQFANSSQCAACYKSFTLTRRRHHCRRCGDSFCDQHSKRSIRLHYHGAKVRVCNKCFAWAQS